jgi:hypothetical protein
MARPQEVSLERLLGLVGRGDEQAFAELYRRVAPAVFGLVGKVVRNPSQAEEVTRRCSSSCGGRRRGSTRRGARPGPG